MYILIVAINYAPEPTGIAPYTTALARGLEARGHRVRVLTAMPHYPEWRFRDGYRGWTMREVIDGVEVVRLRHYLPKRPIGVGRLMSEFVFGLRVLLARWGRPDAVVMSSPPLFATAVAMLRPRLRTRGPRIVWVQDLYSLGVLETGGGSRVASAVRSIESWVLAKADGVAVIHDRFATISSGLGARDSTLKVVRNWTHVGRGEDIVAREETRRRLGWARDEVVALHTGNMGVKQGLTNLVEAARLVDGIGVPVRFVLVGGGSDQARLREAAQGVKAIEFVESVLPSEYAALLDAADVLVLNEAEGLREMAVPSKLTSYFAAGRPVVAAIAVDGLAADELSRARSGVRVDPGRPQQLLDAVRALAADPAAAAVFAANGLRYSRIELDQERAIDTFDRWIQYLRLGRRNGVARPITVNHR